MKEKIQQRYNFKVRWQAGKKMMISDALSRSPVDEFDVDTQECKDKTATERLIVNAIMNVDAEKVFGDQKLIILLQKANADQEYIELRNLVDKGSPKRSILPNQLKP